MTDRASPPDDNEVDEYFPQFSTVRRGYDPTEVEQVLDELYASLDAALRESREKAQELHLAQQARRQHEDALIQSREQVAQLQQRLSDDEPASLDALGARIANIVRAAAMEAAEITRAAREEAQVLQDESRTIRDQAQAEADQLVADARQLGESQRQADVEAHDRVTAQAETIVAEAHTQAETITAEAEQHRSTALESRATVRAQLADIRLRLAGLVPGTPPEGGPPTTCDVGVASARLEGADRTD